MKKLFQKQMNKRPNKKRRVIFLAVVILAVILGGLYLYNSQEEFVYDAAAGKPKIEEARVKIYENADYEAAINSLTVSAQGAKGSEQYNILIEKGSYQAQLNQLDQARDTFEQAKKVGGYSNPIVGIALGAYYFKSNPEVAKAHYLGAKTILEQKPDDDPTKGLALKNVNNMLKELEDGK